MLEQRHDHHRRAHHPGAASCRGSSPGRRWWPSQKRRRRPGSSSTRNAQPWLKPALGARTALASARSTTAGSTGVVGVVADHPAAAYDVLELHGGAACLTTSSRCGPTSRRSGGRPPSGGYFRQPFATRRARAAGVVRRAGRGPRACDVESRRVSATSSAWWRRPTGPSGPRRADRLAPRLGARRRGVRRAARRGLGARGGRPCCGRAGSCRRGRSGCRCSWRRRGRGSGWPAWGRGWPPARSPWDARARAARPGRRTPRRRDGRGRARRRRPGRALAGRAVDCFVELHVEQGRDLVDRGARGRGGERDLAARPLPLRLHRRAPTTPARPGWRTGTTRC